LRKIQENEFPTKMIEYEMARVIVLTSEQWFLLSGTENTDGRHVIAI
jgi:hypothetical protein